MLDASKPGHHLLLVDIFLRQREYDAAIRQSDVLLQRAGHSDEALWRKARALRLGGDVDAASQLLRVDGKHGAPFLYEKGLTLEQLDRLGEAESAFRDATESDPAMAVAWHALGVIQLKQGDTVSAARSLSRASKLDPRNAESKINLVTAVRLGADIKGALLLSEALLKEHGDLADVHTQYAATLQALGRFEEAEKEFLEARELHGENVAALAGLAELAEWRGDYAAGLKLLDEAGELTAPDLIVSRARLLQRSGHAVEAADLLRREEAEGMGWRPWHRAQAGFSLAHILDELGDYPAAFEAAARANLIRGGRFDSAAHTRWVDRVIELAPTTAGEGAETDSRPVFILGMPRSGTSLLEQILSGHSALYAAGELPLIGEIAACTPAWLSAGNFPDLIVSRARLLQRSGHAVEAADLLRREEAEGMGWRPWHRAQAGFSLAHILDELGDYPAAFEAAARANLIRGGRFDSAAHTRWVDRVIELAPTTAGEGAETDSRPVFILGMPRSGTSLLEQILSGHSALYAAGELPLIGEIAACTPAWLSAGNNARQLAGLGRKYLESLPAAAVDATLVSDKMPLNYLYLGLIAAILPNARVIHCLRDPRDVAVSCFFQDFVDPALAFGFGLRPTADYYRDYWRLMAHWRERLAQPILEVHYEHLVSDIEQQTRRVLEFLGLPMEQTCLSFHERERPVKTASHAQVRRPLYQSSVGRYRNYQQQIEALICDPLEDILEQYQVSLDGQG